MRLWLLKNTSFSWVGSKSLRHGLATLAIGALGLGYSPVASAQDAEGQFSAKKAENLYVMLEVHNSGQIEAELNRLKTVIQDPGLTAYERSTIYQKMGQYSYEFGRPKESQQNFENAINAGGLSPNEMDNMRIVIAQLMIGNGQYREGAQRLETYLNSGGQQKPRHIELLLNAWVQAEDYRRALPWAEKWFNAANPKERRHFDLLNFLFNNLGMQGRQVELVKDMVERWPEDQDLRTTWIAMGEN